MIELNINVLFKWHKLSDPIKEQDSILFCLKEKKG